MRHHDKKRTLGRDKDQRTALLRSLMESLLVHEGIVTTLAKAKEVRPYMEKLVTKGKADNLSSRKLVYSRIGHSNAAKKLFSTIAPRYAERNGGYLRIIKMPRRMSDSAEMARIEFV